MPYRPAPEPGQETYTLPANLHEINSEMNDLSNRADDLVKTLEAYDQEATEMRYRSDQDYVIAFGAANGPMDVRKNIAKEAQQEHDWKARVAESKVRSLKLRLGEIAQRQDTLRSMGANIKDEMRNLGHGYGGTP